MWKPKPICNQCGGRPGTTTCSGCGWSCRHTGDEYPHFFKFMVDELDRFFHGHETYFDLTPRSRANRQGAD